MSAAARSGSIHSRLLALARERREDFNLIVGRYAIERLLYRLSISQVCDQFVLKGALLFDLWFHAAHRPTRDADLLGLGPSDVEALTATIRDVCVIHVDDGMRYDADSVAATNIREDSSYGGLRVTLHGLLGTIRSRLQLDVGYGDTVTPPAKKEELPVLLEDLPAPRLQVYPRETVVAEKLEAIVSLGMINSRMKDYFDLLALAREGALDTVVLARAIAATFERRGTPLPQALPIGLTAEFANDAEKRSQWNAFLSRNSVAEAPLDTIVEELEEFLREPLANAHAFRRPRGAA